MTLEKIDHLVVIFFGWLLDKVVSFLWLFSFINKVSVFSI